MTITEDPRDLWPLDPITTDDLDAWAQQGGDPDAPETSYEPKIIDGVAVETLPLPHTPTTPTPGSSERAPLGPRLLHAAAVAGGWTIRRLADMAWWVAVRAARHPAAAVVTVGAVVALTPVSVEQSAGMTALLAVIAVVSPGNGRTRRERVLSVVAATTFRHRRRFIRRLWAKLWANAGLTQAPTTPGADRRRPAFKGARAHRYGITTIVDGHDVGVGVLDIISHATSLCNTVGARSLRVSVPEPRGVMALLPARPQTKIHLTFKYDDPFPRVVPVDELPSAARPGYVVVGPDEDGGFLEKHMLLPSMIVGQPGAGKSSEVWTTLRQLRRAGIPFRLRVFDPKGGMEMGDLREVAFRYESMPSGWARFLAQACGALQVRQRIATQRGLRTLEISDEFPLDLMIIDELVTVLAMSKGLNAKVVAFGQEMTAREAFLVYLSQIRSANASVIALTQDVRQEVLGPVRGMFPYISCLRMGPTEAESVDIVLGRGAHKAFPAHTLAADGTDAGKGWCRTKSGILMYRAGFMDDAERAAEAAEIGRMTANFRARGQQDPEVATTVRAPRAPRAPRAGRTNRAAAGQ